MKNKNYREYTAQFYKNNKISYIVAIVATFLNTLLGFAITWILQEMLDAAVGVEGAMSIKNLLAGTFAVVFSLLFVKALVYFSKPKFLKKAMVQFKNFIFEKLMRKSIMSFKKESQAEYLSAFSNDMGTIEKDYLESEFLLVRNTIEMTGALLMMLFYNPLMTAIAISFLLIPIAAAAFQGNRMERAEKHVSSENAKMMSLFKDCLGGFSVIKSFASERRMSDIVDKRVVDTEDAKCKKRKISALLDSIGDLSGLIAQLGTFLCGTALILSGKHMTPGVLVAFMDLTSTFIDPVSELPDLTGNRKASKGLIVKLSEKLKDNIRVSKVKAPRELKNGITLSNLGYSYEKGSRVLKNINFVFEKDKSYALVGASGSGKSTILNLLSGSDEYEGHILYDDKELKDIHSDSLFELISIIQQNVFIFNSSIKDNITMFSNFRKEDIENAVKLSGLSNLVDEKGFDYLCGENGSNLSGGEKQRISIARTLLSKSKVIFADEATASLDKKTACMVSDSILNLEGMTKIVVTHTLDASILRRYDSILTIKHGEIVESGKFDELMEEKGYFYSLYTIAQ